MPAARNGSGARRAPAAVSALVLLGSLALVVSGAVRERLMPRPRREEPRLVMVFISGFSWEKVVSLRREGRIPTMDGLFRRGGCWGDIMSEGGKTDTAILATIITGRFPQKHRIFNPEDIVASGKTARYQTPVWKVLEKDGQRCAAIGFPLRYPPESGAGASREVSPATPPPASSASDTSAVAGGETLPAGLAAFLSGCLSEDRSRLAAAVKAASDDATRHLFVYAGGLGRWQERLRTAADNLSAAARTKLTDNYYIFLDTLLAGLPVGEGSGRTLFIVSERGNLDGWPSYRKYFPRLESYPALGFLFAVGPHIRPATLPLTINPADLAPTMLYLTGNPVINDSDGRVIFGFLDEDYYYKHTLIFR